MCGDRVYYRFEYSTIAQIPVIQQQTKYSCSVLQKQKSILSQMKTENVCLPIMLFNRVHIQSVVIRKVAKQPAGGGCGRPAMIRLLPPLSAMTARSFTLVTTLTMMTAFAPRCG